MYDHLMHCLYVSQTLRTALRAGEVSRVAEKQKFDADHGNPKKFKVSGLAGETSQS